MSPTIPDRAVDLTPEWLTAALASVGTLRRRRVVAAPSERVGQDYGFTGLIMRIRLEYADDEGDPPRSLIAKLPMAQDDAVSGYRAAQERDPSLWRRYYERCSREVRFYREIGAELAPTLYYAATDDRRQRAVLLLEDMSGGRQGDVLRGCSIADARRVIDVLAPFHARWLGRRAPWGFERLGPDPRARQERYACNVDRFLDRYGDELPPAVRRIVTELRPRLAAIAHAMSTSRQTLIHGDLHLDNLIFDPRADRSVVVLDWQTASVGPPASDVAFFFDSLTVEDRRAAEAELFDRYLTLLSLRGVRGYTVEALRLECGLALLVRLAGTVGWLTSLDTDSLTERERALQDAVFTNGRFVAALLDYDVASRLADLTPAP